ncbi:hypothetical protein CBW65_02015 [Tumebacillus avium]|uniref:Putative amidase domain-containing protein n=1 Tax=Tumebacillus avium TaxID=1903704 RepID=A0A1Y0IHJ5_9BACL|nr:amidase domain-containing protein [Tumebacillus avium]ARU59971.1 hypothetical protein CBW65_02015 [Tumebacillus avium]
MKKLAVLSLIAVTMLTVGLGGNASANVGDQNKADIEKSLQGFVKHAFQKKNDRYLSDVQTTLGSEFSMDVIKKYQKDLAQDLKGLKDAGLKYKKQNTELSFNKVELNGNLAVVEVGELVKYYLQSVSNPSDTSIPEFTVDQETHQIVLEKDSEGNWVIVADEVLNGSKSAPVTMKALEKAREKKPSYVGKVDHPVENNAVIAPELYWDGIAAANYARQYAINYNWNYRSFSQDCTNFVSQAEKKGGLPYVDGWYQDELAWWYNDTTQTYTWVNAEDHYWLLSYTDRGSYTSSTSNLRLGDVIQIDFTSDGVVDHTTIVTAIDASGNIYISQHTSNSLDKPLSLIKSNYPSGTFYFWKMAR